MKGIFTAALLLLSFGASAAPMTLDFADPSVPTTGMQFNLGGLKFAVTEPAPNPPGYQTDSYGNLGVCPGCELTITDLASSLAYDTFSLESISFLVFPSDYVVRLTVDYGYDHVPDDVFDLTASAGLHTLNL